MGKIILEDCYSENVKKFIEECSESNGHGAFGESEWNNYNYVIIKGKRERLYSKDEYYIAHNGNEVIDIGTIKYLGEKIAVEINPELKEYYKEERFKKYIELKKEFEIK